LLKTESYWILDGVGWKPGKFEVGPRPYEAHWITMPGRQATDGDLG
jgi:hypothetical protein